MHSFSYKDAELYCEDVSLESLANAHGTPLYVYSANTFLDHYRKLDQAMAGVAHEVAYAVKANSNLSILKLLANEGSGFDIVSAGELYRVIKAGGDPGKCTFAGVAKTDDEIRFALEHDIYSFNAESEAELLAINRIAGEMGKKAPIAIRVNPNVDAKTHKYISTGKSENKFGVDFEVIEAAYERASKLKHLHIRGLQMHIGSQLTSISPFVEAVEKVAPLITKLKELYGIEFWSIGGGIGIVYEPALESGEASWWEEKSDDDRPLTPAEYAEKIIPLVKDLGVKILMEPGRFIAGNAGALVTQCIYEKKGSAKTFKIVDAGMNDLIRPALYEGHHEIISVKETQKKVAADVVGPVCETGDFFCQNREVADISEGELYALLSAGAYGFVMASNYNTRPLPTEILVNGSDAKIIRKRQTWDEILSSEVEAL